jgi:hypothetical protein
MKKIDHNSVPKSVELFGRTVKTVNETGNLNHFNYGEARYGCNQIAVSNTVGGNTQTDEEFKLTYLHEMVHFILNFTGFESQIKNSHIDLEQFVELMAAGIYQYEKSRKY